MKNIKPKHWLILLAILCMTFVGYKIAQGLRYTPFGHNNMFLWDNWKGEPASMGEQGNESYEFIYGNK